MSQKHLDIKVDYKKLQIYTEYNTADFACPLILTVPHAGRVLPESFIKQSGMAEKDLRGNEDLFVDELISPLKEKGLTILSLNISRAFIDVNRDKIELDPNMFYDYPQNQIAVENNRCRFGLGLIHRINAQNKPIYSGLLSYQEVNARIENVYEAYHKRLQQLINKCLKKFGFCFVLDCHSMPSKICGIIPDSPKIDFCIGNLFNKSCPSALSDAMAQSLSKKGYHVSANLPYSGAFTTFNYCQPRRKIYTLQLEINRGLYANEQNLSKNTHFQQISKDICASIDEFSKKVLDF